jgi:DNA topoisomerase-1
MAPFLKPEQLKLYTLIWKRYVASQMADAVYKVVTAEVEIEDTVLQTSGTATVFDGFTSLYTSAKDEDTEIEDGKQKLPDLKKGETFR